MLKPSDVPSCAPLSAHDLQERAAIEEHIDRALKSAGERGAWPCRPGRTRSGWRAGNVTAVIDAYRAAGWIVQETPGADSYAIFSLPAVR